MELVEAGEAEETRVLLVPSDFPVGAARVTTQGMGVYSTAGISSVGRVRVLLV